MYIFEGNTRYLIYISFIRVFFCPLFSIRLELPYLYNTFQMQLHRHKSIIPTFFSRHTNNTHGTRTSVANFAIQHAATAQYNTEQ